MRKQFARLFGLADIQNDAPADVLNKPDNENVLILQEAAASAEPVIQATDEMLQNEPALHNIQRVLLSAIEVNPFQPRKTFNDHSLDELSQSIKEYGVIQPVLVRKVEDRYELVAGERRLRAAKLAGLETIPAIVKDLNEKETAEIAMIENLQREDLNFMEEAEGYQLLLSTFGLTQEELARRVGKSQSTVANKLRLLKLSPAVRQEISQEIITERHARALLKLPDEQHQLEVMKAIKEKEMTVRQTEEYIDQTLSNISREIDEATPKQRIIRIFKDVRIFVNTIHNVVNEMRKAGLDIKMKETSDADYVTIHLQIPKRK